MEGKALLDKIINITYKENVKVKSITTITEKDQMRWFRHKSNESGKIDKESIRNKTKETIR